MKKYLLFFFPLTILVGAQLPIYVAPPTSVPTINKTEKKEAPKQATSSEIAAIKQSQTGSHEVMIISPELRAKDIKAAIQYLKTRSPASKPIVKLINRTNIENIIDIDMMPGGTILIFQVSSLKGIQYKLAKTEDIDTLYYE